MRFIQHSKSMENLLTLLWYFYILYHSEKTCVQHRSISSRAHDFLTSWSLNQYNISNESYCELHCEHCISSDILTPIPTFRGSSWRFVCISFHCCRDSTAFVRRISGMELKEPKTQAEKSTCSGSILFGMLRCSLLLWDVVKYVARKSSILSRMVLAATRSIQFFELSIAMKHHEIFNTPTFVINCKDLHCFPSFQL